MQTPLDKRAHRPRGNAIGAALAVVVLLVAALAGCRGSACVRQRECCAAVSSSTASQLAIARAVCSVPQVQTSDRGTCDRSLETIRVGITTLGGTIPPACASR